MPNHRVRRTMGAGIAIACGWLAVVVSAPSAYALISRPEGSGSSPTPATQPLPLPVHTVVVGGMAGWQIVLIAMAAALLAATSALLVERARRSHRHVRPSTA